MIDRQNFDELVSRAMSNSTVSHMRPVVEKELLHYDILFSLEKEGLLDGLTFQGGTSLRLCYGGNRYSEDLDFAGGKDFTAKQLDRMKDCIETYIGGRYGLEVTVKEPKSLKEDPRYAELKIDKWQIAVVTAPERKDMPKQRIKVEVANIPAYTRAPMAMKVNYSFLPDGYSDTLILTETLDELMADKLVSLPATQNYVRHRDIWDLSWLLQQGASIQEEWVLGKVNDYSIGDYPKKLRRLIERLPTIITSGQFNNEMRRFTPTDVYDRTLGKPAFEQYLTNNVSGLFKELQSRLAGDRQEPDFLM
jgi:predicted nucleotidyltransferase component of viral defense system